MFKLRTKGDTVFEVVLYILMALVFLCVAYPLYFIIIASFSDTGKVFSGEIWLFPVGIQFEGYKRLLDEARVWTGYRNTIFYTVLGTCISLIISLPAGYALSRKDLVGRRGIAVFFIFTMFFSGGLIPTYFTIKNLNMLDTIWALLIPVSVDVFNLLIIRTFFASTLPQELLEASQIDGCSNTRFFVQVALPLSKAIISVISLYVAVSYWNQYFAALVYIKDKQLVPLQLVLREILIMNQTMSNRSHDMQGMLQRIADQMKFAAIIVSTLPILCFYPFIQKYFYKGIMIGSVKG